MSGQEWETVPAAARRLGIGEWKAYRHASKLSGADMKMSDSGRRLVHAADPGAPMPLSSLVLLGSSLGGKLRAA